MTGPLRIAFDWIRRHRALMTVMGLLLVAPLAGHCAVGVGTRLRPPPVSRPPGDSAPSPLDPELRVFGPAYARHRGKILEVRLEGTPEQIGYQHARMLYPEMVENERVLFDQFRRLVPLRAFRTLLVDVGRLEFRAVDQGMPVERRSEIAAKALGMDPDPFANYLDTYSRFAYLEALYDIALSFEHSPMLGCTSFALSEGAAEGGHVMLARNFDFEAGSIFDEEKALFLVRQDGRIPYASVAWPGLVGAVTGMNQEGVALVVHGGRARTPRPRGEPVLHTMRDVLGEAHTTREAIELMRRRDPMVSHLVFVADPTGDIAIVERAPGAEPFVRRGSRKVPLTNHFEGPFASDPKNLRVRAKTSTLARRRRLDELLAELPDGASVDRIVGVLRDRAGVGGKPLPLGDRRAIDALIATHSVVMDLSARLLYLSEGPHLIGRYVRFDLGALLDKSYQPRTGEPLMTQRADDLLTSGAYARWVEQGSVHAPDDEGQEQSKEQ